MGAEVRVTVPGGRIEGEVLVNGHPQEAATFARISGYVCPFPPCSGLAALACLVIPVRVTQPHCMSLAKLL